MCMCLHPKPGGLNPVIWQVLAELAVDDLASMAKAGAVPKAQRAKQAAAAEAEAEEDEGLQARLDAVRG